MIKPREDFRIAKGWRKIATGHWLYDGIIPKQIALWAKPASESFTRYNDEDQELDESRPIPASFDYAACSGLSREMVEKLSRIRPSTLGQASRIAGVTPAAVSLIQCFLEIQKRQRNAA